MILIKTFNGFSLTNSNYVSTASSAKTPPDAKNVFLEQTNADAIFAGVFARDIRNIGIVVRIVGSGMEALEALMKEAMRPGTSGLLVGTFTDENRDYQLNCVVQSIHLVSNHENLWMIVLQTGETAWHAVTESTDSWSVSASGDKKVITVGGYSETKLSLTLTPTILPETGWAYQKFYQLVNKPGYAYGLRPWAISLDTAALVTAGKMQADCDDLRVIVDGIEVNRWLADANTDHTKIWVNLNLAAGQSLVLLTPVASSGDVSALTFAATKNNSAALAAMPARGFVQHGTEWFEYTGKDLKTYKLTGITRGAFGTALQAHSAADSFLWVEHSIFLIYGNSAATAPSLTDWFYDDTKPIFDLSASSNDVWVYTASTKFYDLAYPQRTGGWTPSITRVGDESELYLYTGNVDGAAPAMGMQISTWFKSGKATAEKATLAWMFKNSGGISAVSMTGKKYRSGTTWPAVKAAMLQRSLNGSTWVEVWSELTPSAAADWEAITHADAAITSNMPVVRFVFTGSLTAVANIDTFFEVLTATVTMVSANLPTGTLGSEKTNYLLDVSITNNANGDRINLVFPMVLNAVMALDGEAYETAYEGVNAASALSLDDESRAVWIRLAPGANELEISGNDIATLTVGLSWLERRI